MFSGYGGELLFAPFASRLAYSTSIYHAKKRDYDRSFKHLDYSTNSAFVSAFWASPFYNYDVGMHYGRYLAEDIGQTLQLRRTFVNGTQIGVFATLTDMPFATFGEGSFDKGLWFKIPFATLTGTNTRAHYKTRIKIYAKGWWAKELRTMQVHYGMI